MGFSVHKYQPRPSVLTLRIEDNTVWQFRIPNEQARRLSRLITLMRARFNEEEGFNASDEDTVDMLIAALYMEYEAQ